MEETIIRAGKAWGLIDGGHFSTENVVVPVLAGWLREDFPGLDVRISERCVQPERFFV